MAKASLLSMRAHQDEHKGDGPKLAKVGRPSDTAVFISGAMNTLQAAAL